MRRSLYDYCTGQGEQDLLRQWDQSKNGDLTPNDISYGSRRKVWWRCGKGHEWQAIVKSRVSGCGCPVCTNREITPGENDLATANPHLAAQWHPTKNGALSPKDVAAGTHRKVWWRCEKGHEWYAAVFARNRGADCPICTGKRVVSGENDLTR